MTAGRGDYGMTKTGYGIVRKDDALIDFLAHADAALSWVYMIGLSAYAGELESIRETITRVIECIGAGYMPPRAWLESRMRHMTEYVEATFAAVKSMPRHKQWFVPRDEAEARLNVLRAEIRRAEVVLWRAILDSRHRDLESIAPLWNRLSSYVEAIMWRVRGVGDD